jgi:hypothetical protein
MVRFNALYLAAALLLAAAAMPAPAGTPADAGADRAAIERTVGYYVAGLDNHDPESIRRAFHPAARLQQAIAGPYVQISLEEFVERVKAPAPANAPKPNWRKITSVDVFGNVAVARLENDFPAMSLVDYLTLLKVDGEWKIVNKAFHRSDK